MTIQNVPKLTNFLGKLSNQCSGALFKLGDVETKLFSEDTRDIEIKSPVFITGVPRSGSTILLEIMASIDGTATHRYSDFPFLQTIVFWNMIFKMLPGISSEKQERAHQDGLMVNKHSPESMDEMLWMAFFDNIHQVLESDALDSKTSNLAFEEFYKAHVKKLLYVRKGERYICKNNYAVSRIEYLLQLFPDAKFIVPFRNPVDHIYSLVKQHKLISIAQHDDPKALNYMNWCGHFEFGLNFKPIHFTNAEIISDIQTAWHSEDWIRAYVMQWRETYTYLLNLKNSDIGESLHFVSYDHLCDNSAEVLKNISNICGLEVDDSFVQAWSKKIKKPEYYVNGLNKSEQTYISSELDELHQNLCSKLV